MIRSVKPLDSYELTAHSFVKVLTLFKSNFHNTIHAFPQHVPHPLGHSQIKEKYCKKKLIHYV